MRTHGANTLLRWAAGAPDHGDGPADPVQDISTHADLYPMLLDDVGAESWAEAARRLAASVPVA